MGRLAKYFQISVNTKTEEISCVFFFGKVGVVYPSLIAHLLLASYIPVSLFLSVRWFIYTYIYIYYIYNYNVYFSVA